jgi:tetratricopeptide (TPR) repeat protein
MQQSESPQQPADDATRAWVAAAASHFNAGRYWYAHDGWREAALRAPSELRPFYEGLILVTWGLAHLQERKLALARRELSAGLEMLGPFGPVQGDLIVEEVVDMCTRLLGQLEVGVVPYLIPPLLKYVGSSSTAEPSTAR